MLLLTVLVLLFLTLMSFVIFNNDILSPSVVVSMGLLFSSFCAFYNEERWALNFSGNTTLFITTGVMAFIIGGIVAIFLANIFKKNKYSFSHPICEIEPIIIKNYKTILVIIFQLILTFWLYKHIQQVTGGGVWTEMAIAYRTGTGRLADLNDDTFKLPFILRQFLEANFFIGLTYAYIVGNNIAAKAKKNILDWTPLILASIITFMQAYRSDMLRFWIAVLVVSYTLKMRAGGWRHNKDTKKMIKKMALSFVGIGVLFIMLKEFVGRVTDMDGFYYVAFYAGSPVAALDLFLKDPLPSSFIWGKETFYLLNQNIKAWLDMPELNYIFYKEFRMAPNGTWIGNVYTALRPPYYDFGYAGMLLFMFSMGLFFTFFYYQVRKKHGNSLIDFRLLVYSYVAYTFFLYFYNLYNNFISTTMLKNLFVLYCIRWYLLDFKFKLKR